MKKELILSRELADISMALTEIMKQEFKACAGVDAPTLTQFRILHAIREGICHVGRLADTFGNSQPATSKMVDNMVKEGLLRRVPHPRDRRQIELRLTPRAKGSFETIYKRAFAKIDERLARLPAAKKQALAKHIHEISRLLSVNPPPIAGNPRKPRATRVRHAKE